MSDESVVALLVFPEFKVQRIVQVGLIFVQPKPLCVVRITRKSQEYHFLMYVCMYLCMYVCMCVFVV